MRTKIEFILDKFFDFIQNEAYPALFEKVRRHKEINFLNVADDLPLVIVDVKGKLQYELIDRIRICTYEDESLEVHFLNDKDDKWHYFSDSHGYDKPNDLIEILNVLSASNI